MNYSSLKRSCYTYLGFKGIGAVDETTDSLIDECFKELFSIARFRTLVKKFDYRLDFLNEEPYLSFLDGCKEYYITCYTLGVEAEKRIKQLRFTDLTKMVIMDACASSYLEYLSDEFDKTLGDNNTYRFCPGYQGSKASDLKYIFNIMDISKIGIELLESNIMVPQKSMVGIIGIGKQAKKTCGKCILREKCEFLKEKKRCYD